MKKAADVLAIHFLTGISCRTTAVNCQKSWIVCGRKKEKKATRLRSFQESRAKISMTFLKSCFFRHKNRNQMAHRETKAFPILNITQSAPGSSGFA